MDGITKAKAGELFSCNAVLIGKVDCIPEEAAERLLGKEAVSFAHRMDKNPGILCNAYGAGGFLLSYLTWEGFLIACTYTNVIAFGSAEGKS